MNTIWFDEVAMKKKLLCFSQPEYFSNEPEVDLRLLFLTQPCKFELKSWRNSAVLKQNNIVTRLASESLKLVVRNVNQYNAAITIGIRLICLEQNHDWVAAHTAFHCSVSN